MWRNGSDSYHKCFVLTTCVIRLFPLSLSSFCQGCISFCLKDVSISFVSAGLWKCLLHLKTSPDVEGGSPAGLVPGAPWTSSSGHSHALCEVAWCSWPSVFGVSWLPCSCQDATPMKTFLQAAPRSVSFVFVSVVFTLLDPCVSWSFPSCLEFTWLSASPRRWRSGCTLCSPSGLQFCVIVW